MKAEKLYLSLKENKLIDLEKIDFKLEKKAFFDVKYTNLFSVVSFMFGEENKEEVFKKLVPYNVKFTYTVDFNGVHKLSFFFKEEIKEGEIKENIRRLTFLNNL